MPSAQLAVAHTVATQARTSTLYVWENGLNPEQLTHGIELLRQESEIEGTPLHSANRADRRAAAKRTPRKPAKKATR